MTEQEIRLRCLEAALRYYANGNFPYKTWQHVRELAERMQAWIEGRPDPAAQDTEASE